MSNITRGCHTPTPVDEDDDEPLVSRVSVRFDETPRRLYLRGNSAESVSSHISSSHVSLGDVDLISVPSFHSGGTSNPSLEDLLADDEEKAMTMKSKKKSKKTVVCCKSLRRYLWYHPWTRIARKRYRRVPARYKYLCFIVWVSWKFVATFLVVYFVSKAEDNGDSSPAALRLLYMVTAEAIIPDAQSSSTAADTWIRSVTHLAHSNHGNIVDAVLILGDPSIDPKLEASWRFRLPKSVNLFIWTDAIPWRVQEGRLVEERDALWLQHRFVMMDRWSEYDIFMSWHVDAYVTAAHVDFFWKQSRKMTEVLAAIPGFVSVSLASNETDVPSATGPFDARVCCGTEETSSIIVEDPSLLALKARLPRANEDSSIALLPSQDLRPGWMMTNQQLGRIHEECASFLPSTDYGPDGCFWRRWVDLRPEHYSYHFVQHSTKTASSLSPNLLWKDLGETSTVE